VTENIIKQVTDMKGVESFLWLLAVAIVIIVVFSLFSGSFIAPGEEQLSVIEEYTPGIVGFSTEIPSQTIILNDFTIGQTQDQFLKGVLEMTVNQGAFGGNSQRLRVEVDDAFLELKRKVRVSFSVLEAVPIGNLIIKWNGKEFYNAKPSGKVTFSIDKDAVKRENFIEFIAEGPGLQFWSATSYKIRNLQINLEYGPQKIVPFDLLPSEIQSFDRGEIEFFGSGPGVLTVKLNGFQIYNGTPSGPNTIEFDVTYINPGNNVLSFISTQYNSLLGGIFNVYSFGNQITSSRTFVLTQEQVDLVKGGRGRVIINVENIIKPGNLLVELNGEVIMDTEAIEGENTIIFSEAVEGENVLEITSTGTLSLSGVTVAISS